ncbi:MAG: Ref family recombination enhancement nuclease [Janthinobacterium lividum]
MIRAPTIARPREGLSRSTPMKRKPMKRKGRKRATKAESAYMGRVARLGCIVCRNLGLGESPAEIHHPRFLAGGGQRAGHMDVIGLCAMHHRLGGHGVAIHDGQETWELIYGTEAELLEQTKRETGVIEENS